MCWFWEKIYRCVAISCLCACTTGYAHGPSAGCIWHTSTLCMYISIAPCSPCELWAGVFITLLPLLASSPLCWKKSFVLFLASKTNWGKSAILAGIQQLWSGNPVTSSEFVPAGCRVPLLYFDTGPVQFWEEELICGVLQQGEAVMLCITLSSICLLAAGKECFAFLLSSQILQCFPQRYKKVHIFALEAMHMNLPWNGQHSHSFKIFLKVTNATETW